MCNKLTADQTAIEDKIGAIEFNSLSQDDASAIANLIAPYIANLSHLATVDEEQREAIREQRHALEHFCAAIIITTSSCINDEHEKLTTDLHDRFETSEHPDFTEESAIVQRNFDTFQHNVRVGHNKLIAAIMDTIERSETIEFIDVYSQAKTQLVLSHQRQSAMEQLSRVMSEGLDEEVTTH